MIWSKPRILKTLKKFYTDGKELAYAQLAKRDQSLLSAAAYHFGSYRKAIEKAGIDYSEVIQRPRWSRQRIIALIKRARRAGEDLHWSAVISRGDELTRAAFAAIQKRLFGGWVRALHAAGLDADDVAVYRAWSRNLVIFELRSRSRDGLKLSSGTLQKEDPGLHAAAVRYFRSHDRALRAAGLDPTAHRVRRRWTRQQVVSDLRQANNDGHHISDTRIRRDHSALYGAAVRLFGSFTAARKAAKIQIKGRKRA